MEVVPRTRLSSGAMLPVIGLGTFHSEPELMGRAVTEALRLGYRHFDSAYLYPSEEELGKALSKALHSDMVRREDVFVTSKLPMNGMRREKVEYFLRKSLANLRLVYVDLYLIHAPFAVKGSHDEDFWPVDEMGCLAIDDETDLTEVWKGMEEVVRKGLARTIGLSNFNSRQIETICNNCAIKPAVLQVECHPYLNQEDLYRLCRARNITLTAFGILGSTQTVNSANPLLPLILEDPQLLELAAKYQKSVAQLIIRWAFQRGVVSIPSTVDFEQLSENIDVFDFEISEEDMKIIASLNRNLRIFPFDTIKGTTNHPEYPFNIPF